MLQKFVKAIGGDPNKREIEKLAELAEVINDLEPEFEALSDDALRAKTDEFRSRLPSPSGRGGGGEGYPSALSGGYRPL